MNGYGSNNKNDMIPVFLKDGNVDVENTVLKYKDNRNMLTTTQLRLLLSNSVVVKNKIEMEENDFYNKNREKFEYKLSPKMQNEIKYLLIKHIYQCGREEKVKYFDRLFTVSEKLKKIGSSKEKFDEFYRYLEEIVAYIKYYRG